MVDLIPALSGSLESDQGGSILLLIHLSDIGLRFPWVWSDFKHVVFLVYYNDLLFCFLGGLPAAHYSLGH